MYEKAALGTGTARYREWERKKKWRSVGFHPAAADWQQAELSLILFGASIIRPWYQPSSPLRELIMVRHEQTRKSKAIVCYFDAVPAGDSLLLLLIHCFSC